MNPMERVSDTPKQPMPPRAVAGLRHGEFTALLLACVWIILFALIVPVGDFPLNDDWVYALAVRSILQTGHFALPYPSSANVFAQAYWGALFCLPFGFSFTALRVSTAVLGGAGIIAAYLLLRELGARRPFALAGALSLAVNPLYLDLSASFMTDVPFTAVVTASLWLYVRGVRRDAAISVAAAFVLAVVAILIRQFALVLPLAFGVAHLTRKGTGPRAVAIAVLPVMLAVTLQLAFEHWLVASGRTPLIFPSLVSLLPTQWRYAPLHGARLAAMALPYFGLFMTPFVACWALARRPPRRWAAAFLAAALVAALATWHDPLPALGNVLIPSGLGPLTLSDTLVLHSNAPVLPDSVRDLWIAATVLGDLVAVLVLAIFADRLVTFARTARSAEPRRAAWPQMLMLTMIAAYAAGMVLVSYQDDMFDRYLLPLIPAVAAVLAIEPGHSWPVRHRVLRAIPCGLLLAASALFAVPATHDYLAWNRARWAATDSLVRAGVAVDDIDGGYEFNFWHAYVPTDRVKTGRSEFRFYDTEYVIASGPISGYDEVGRFGFDRWLGPSNGNVLVLHRLGH
jgi:4-amino-4-deoxy-L-arabinose transferase-like glycosyltransferase